MLAPMRRPTHQPTQRSTGWFALLSVAVFLLVSVQAIALSAQEAGTRSSLDIVPQNAAFYYSSMNHQAQLDAILDSNAWNQLLDSPVGKNMRKAYRKGKRRGFEQFGNGNPFGEYLKAYRESMGNNMVPLVMSPIKQILGQEVFVYAEEDWLELSEAATEFYSKAADYMQSVDIENMDEEQIKAMLALAREHLADAKTPTLVFGTYLKEPDGVKSLLQIAESGIDTVIGEMPESMDPLVDGFDVINEKDTYMMTLQLDADSLPWDELENDAEMAPYLDDIRAIAKGKTFNLSVGVKDNFLLIAVSDTNQHIMDLGKGELLRDHPKFAPLRDSAKGNKLTSVAYYSEAAATNAHEQYTHIIDTVVDVAEMVIETSGEDKMFRGLAKELKRDAADLKADIESMMGKPGARLGFSYMFDGGIEGYIYNWAENKNFDSSKPLTILKHVGDEPVMVSASREIGGKDRFNMMRKWGGKVYTYATKYGPRGISETDDALMFVQVAGELRSILGDAGDSTENDLLSAIAGQETAFVMDWSNEKKSWHEQMPRSSKALPGPAIGVIVQHNDRSKILKTGAAYYEAVAEILEVVREIPDSQISDEFDLYAPDHESADDGDYYMYRLPPQAGLDDDVAFHAYVSDKHLVLGHSLQQTKRLLSGGKAKLDGVADPSKPAMSVFYYNNNRMMDVVDAWAGYAIEQVKENGGQLDLDFDAENDMLEFSEQQLLETWDRVMDVAKCFKGISSRSYAEDGAQVTHYQWRFNDVVADE